MSEDNDDLPKDWPRIGDRLFVQNCWKFDAPIATFRGERLYRMKKAFKSAADLLVIYTEENAHERANLVWPIVFCYRQYIELALKDVIAEYGPQMENSQAIEPNWNTHSLKELWTSYKQITNSTLCEVTADGIPEIMSIEACIDELDGIDSGSYTFRYPTDKRGHQIGIPFSSIDLYHLRDVMEGIYGFLDANESVLDAHFNPPYP
jgi:hypothetical protein